MRLKTKLLWTMLGSVGLAGLAAALAFWLTFSAGHVWRQTGPDAMHFWALSILLLLLLLFVPLGLWLARRAVEVPVERLLAGVHALEEGRFDAPVPDLGRCEFGMLGRAVNDLAAALAQGTEALRASEARYRHMVETAAEGIAELVDGRLSYANHRLAAMLGRSGTDLSGWAIGALVDQRDLPLLERALDGGAVEVRLRTAQEGPAWAMVTAARLPGAGGQLYMFTDLTARKLDEIFASLGQAMDRQLLGRSGAEDLVTSVGEELLRRFDLLLVQLATPAGDGLDARLVLGPAAQAHAASGLTRTAGAPEARVLGSDRLRLVSVAEGGGEGWTARAAALGASEVLALPLAGLPDGGEGVLSLYSDSHFRLGDPDLLQRFGDLGHRLNMVLRLMGERQDLRLQAAAVDAAANAIVITDAGGHIQWVNRAFENLSGWKLAEVKGKTPRLISSGTHSREFYAQLWRTVLEGNVWKGMMVNRRRDGSAYTVEQIITPVLDDLGRPSNFITIQQDITERMRAEEQLEFLRSFDPLTGLPNREHFLELADGFLAVARENRTRVAVLQLNLDRFKYVNDSLGRNVGDRLLVTVGRRLARLAGPGGVVSRLGADEFGLLVRDLASIESLASLAGRILEEFARPLSVEGHEVFAVCSMGLSVFPEDGAQVDQLVAHAEAALARAKQAGGNRFFWYTEDMASRAQDLLTVELALRRGLAREELFLNYQPQVRLSDGRIIGAEALVRWQHPEWGVVPPGRFIPVAESTGLIAALGNWVLEAACHQCRQWMDAGHSLTVAVNVSPHQLREGDLPTLVAQVLAKTGLPGRCLELEITESAVVDDPDQAIRLLMAIRDMGVQLSIDDFGTGYSSLAQLRRLPVDRLKVDQSFVRDMASNHADAQIVATIIAMACNLGLKVIAEGVEDLAQLELLRAQACDEVQGYYFSRPVSAADFGQLLNSGGFLGGGLPERLPDGPGEASEAAVS